MTTSFEHREAVARTVGCPQCGGESFYTPDNRFRPFCSKRCKQIDLGAWASEDFTLPVQVTPRDPDFEQS